MSAHSSRRGRPLSAPLLFPSHSRPGGGSGPQRLGSPDPTQEMGQSLPPRNWHLVSGLRPDLQGKQSLALRNRQQMEAGLSSSRWGNQWSLGSESSVEKAFPVASFWPAVMAKVGSEASEASRLSSPTGHWPALALAWHVCSYMFNIQLGRQTASLRNYPCSSLPCQTEPRPTRQTNPRRFMGLYIVILAWPWAGSCLFGWISDIVPVICSPASVYSFLF